MKILIANLDYIDDPYNESFTKNLDRIRKYNSRGYGISELFDPYGEEGECTMGGVEKIFGYARTGLYNGIIEMSSLYKDLYTAWDGYPQIELEKEVFINPIYMPFLTQETLVACMPHIPWDEFGNHLRLEGQDAEQFVAIWNSFIQQNKDLYNAVYRLEYPVDESRSNISYIFMDKEIE